MPLPVVTLDGRVVGDVKFKWLESGQALARFRMVCADRRKGDDGKWFDAETLWITVSVFGKLAENVLDSLNDRDAVVVIGKLSTAEWTDASGEKRTSQKVVASSVAPSLAFIPRPHAGAAPSTPPVGAERQTRRVSRETPEVTPTGVSAGPGGVIPDDPWGY